MEGVIYLVQRPWKKRLFRRRNRTGLRAVSYTHLDVYKRQVLLTPFMSCSAKLPIYAMFTAAFFPEHPALVMICLYAGGMAVGVLCGLVLKNTAFHGKPCLLYTS